MTTTKTKTTIKRLIHKIDATDQSMGRLASKVATLLRGKQKPEFKKHIDSGDFVIIENIKKMKFTGNKFEDSVRYRHSQYPGGLKALPLKRLWEKDAGKVFAKTVEGMLPKNKLRREWLKRLSVNKDNGDN